MRIRYRDAPGSITSCAVLCTKPVSCPNASRMISPRGGTGAAIDDGALEQRVADLADLQPHAGALEQWGSKPDAGRRTPIEPAS